MYTVESASCGWSRKVVVEIQSQQSRTIRRRWWSVKCCGSCWWWSVKTSNDEWQFTDQHGRGFYTQQSPVKINPLEPHKKRDQRWSTMRVSILTVQFQLYSSIPRCRGRRIVTHCLSLCVLDTLLDQNTPKHFQECDLTKNNNRILEQFRRKEKFKFSSPFPQTILQTNHNGPFV